MGCSSPTYNYHPQSRGDTPYYNLSPWYVSHPYQSIPSEPYGMYSYSYNPYSSPYGSTFQSGSSESKAFVVKLLNNQIKKCRGCNGEFSRKVDGSLPDPPLNVVVCHEDGHLETHQMSRDSVGPKMCIIVQISRAFSCLIISIYRLTLSCLMLIRNTFVNTLGVTVDLSTWNSFCLVHLPVSLVHLSL